MKTIYLVTIITSLLINFSIAGTVKRSIPRYNTTPIVETIKEFENHKMAKKHDSFEDHSREDKLGNVVEIGYGFTANGIEDAVRYKMLKNATPLPKKMLKSEADKFLLEIIIPTYAKMVDANVNVIINNSQRNCLIMFAYNLGESNLKKICTSINAGKYDEASNRMKKYVFAGNKKVKGLVRRRNTENEIWKKPRVEVSVLAKLLK